MKTWSDKESTGTHRRKERKERKVSGKRYEARNCGRSSPYSLSFEPAKCPDDAANYCLDYRKENVLKYTGSMFVMSIFHLRERTTYNCGHTFKYVMIMYAVTSLGLGSCHQRLWRSIVNPLIIDFRSLEYWRISTCFVENVPYVGGVWVVDEKVHHTQGSSWKIAINSQSCSQMHFFIATSKIL